MGYRLLFVIIVLLFTACGKEKDEYYQKYTIIDNINNDFEIKKIDNNKNINFKINRNNKDLYILFTNTSNNKYNISLTDNSITYTLNNRKLNLNRKNSVKHSPKYIMDFNHKKVSENKNEDKKIYFKKDKIKDKELFYLEKDLSKSTIATARKIVKNIDTQYGKKSLNIWVSDNSFGKNCSKRYCIEDYMLDELANSFLKDGENNDIYDWVTNIFGEEWGEVDNDSLINKSNEITILLTDINNDNRAISGVYGYFYAKDNYKKSVYKGSNERVMFYIDSVLFASYYGKDKWCIENPQTKKILSTLSHEFEHMIQFYQKNVLYNSKGLKPWIDEMLAVSTEDIIATKLESNGIRSVSYTRGDAGKDYNQYGKFPLFNKNINQTLPIWSNKEEDYAMVSSFGSYLIRNYAGAKLLHDILNNRYNNEKAIVYAVNKSSNGFDKDFYTLMQDWGIAILLSSNTDIGIDSGYLYNLGDFIYTEYKNSTYSMGSIDFFKYYGRPNILTKLDSIEPKSNLYYKVTSKGDIVNINIEKNPNIKVAFIFK